MRSLATNGALAGQHHLAHATGRAPPAYAAREIAITPVGPATWMPEPRRGVDTWVVFAPSQHPPEITHCPGLQRTVRIRSQDHVLDIQRRTLLAAASCALGT